MHSVVRAGDLDWRGAVVGRIRGRCREPCRKAGAADQPSCQYRADAVNDPQPNGKSPGRSQLGMGDRHGAIWRMNSAPGLPV